MVDFLPQWERCAVSLDITTIPSTREIEFSQNVSESSEPFLCVKDVPTALSVCLYVL